MFKQWYRIDEELIFPNENGIALIEVESKKICMTRIGDEWHAFAHKCPHASGRLDEGFIDALGNVVCPVHRYRFSVKNGRNTSGEGYYLKTYKLERRNNGLYIQL